MRSVDFYLENIDNIIESNDTSSMSNTLTILIQNRDYYTPLFNELINKGIDWYKLDPNTANEWNETIMAIARLSKKLYRYYLNEMQTLNENIDMENSGLFNAEGKALSISDQANKSENCIQRIY